MISGLIAPLTNGNYNIMNAPNMYNLLISVLGGETKEKQAEIIELVKIHMGITFWNNFRDYVLRKFKLDSEMARLVS